MSHDERVGLVTIVWLIIGIGFGIENPLIFFISIIGLLIGLFWAIRVRPVENTRKEKQKRE